MEKWRRARFFVKHFFVLKVKSSFTTSAVSYLSPGMSFCNMLNVSHASHWPRSDSALWSSGALIWSEIAPYSMFLHMHLCICVFYVSICISIYIYIYMSAYVCSICGYKKQPSYVRLCSHVASSLSSSSSSGVSHFQLWLEGHGDKERWCHLPTRLHPHWEYYFYSSLRLSAKMNW